MALFKKSIFYFTIILSVILIIASLLSLLYDLPYWLSKILDFPRLQYFILALICLPVFIFLNKRWDTASILLSLGLLASIAIQATRIAPYILGKKEVPDAIEETINKDNSVSILIANVLITNRESERFLQIVERANPDMLLVMEVNDWWINQLQPLKKEYPHLIEYPADNAYGMALYSKLPMHSPEIKFFKHEDVPSFHARVELPSGRLFMFHGIHPVAPVPSDKYPDNVGEEEVALLKVGALVAEHSLPSVIAGDFNDVSWSHTARLFGNKGNLRNIRIGRGLYNSYDAKSRLLRWPLDHFFLTKEFSVAELERLSTFNSDHFPMFARLVLNEPDN